MFGNGRFKHLDLGVTSANTCFYPWTAVTGWLILGDNVRLQGMWCGLARLVVACEWPRAVLAALYTSTKGGSGPDLGDF